ncbi:MAG: hypothetical protein JRD68_07235 [Deltaproteobacteria bacterium]|nr:hypothetical protein [Deltaproteobacteria bacterium]
MNILIFVPGVKGLKQRVQKEMEPVSKAGKEYCHTLEDLAVRLLQLGRRPSILVLIATSQEILSGLFALKRLFDGIQIIIILPHRDEKTIFTGHRFYPRFLGYLDDDFKHMARILKNMVQRELSQQAEYPSLNQNGGY